KHGRDHVVDRLKLGYDEAIWRKVFVIAHQTDSPVRVVNLFVATHNSPSVDVYASIYWSLSRIVDWRDSSPECYAASVAVEVQIKDFARRNGRDMRVATPPRPLAVFSRGISLVL